MEVSFSTIDQLVDQLSSLAAASPQIDKAALALKLKRFAPNADPIHVAIALDTFVARANAAKKLGSWSSHGFFSLALLEQASRAAIATYRASYFAGLLHVLEVGTGVGSDTAALARVCSHVTTIEIDPIRAALAQKNLLIQGIANVTVLVGDVAAIAGTLDLAAFDGFFADPARRTGDGSRVRSASDYAPPLSTLLSLTSARVRAVKVSPGLFYDNLDSGWTRQFVGYGDECLEQTLWYGAPVQDSSVHLVDVGTSWNPKSQLARPLSPHPPLQGYICEAHACVNRSQHLWQFFTERNIQQIASDVSYGISEQRPATDAFLTSYIILQAIPFDPTSLASLVHTLGWTNRTEIKKRNFPGDPDHIRAALRLPPHYHNGPFGTILLFNLGNAPWAVVTQKIDEE